ncbi:signal peptide peptidase SppA [Candidatus Woesearchaeota archaeon]|nr:signal peptide peptidase SppA [Candidatus Woesearchaeota archaeon]
MKKRGNLAAGDAVEDKGVAVRMDNSQKERKKGMSWIWVIIGSVLFVVFIFFVFIVIIIGALVGSGSGSDISGQGNVAVIPVKGTILTDEYSSLLGSSDVAAASTIVEFIEKADSDPKIKAIIFEINSPGGSPVATDEISQAILATNKTTVAWIREYGASGAYWVASSCDVIIANRLSMVGSIGVIGSYLDFSGFLNRYNVSYERLVSGEHKDMGSPYRSLTEEEHNLFQAQLDKMHDIFITEVAKNRGMSIEDVRALADGMVYVGVEADKNNLVDLLGGLDEAVEYIEQEQGIKAELAYYRNEQGFFEMLSTIMDDSSFNIGKGIGESISDEPLTKDIYTQRFLS